MFVRFILNFKRHIVGSRTDNVDRLFFTVVDLRNAFVSQGIYFYT